MLLSLLLLFLIYSKLKLWQTRIAIDSKQFWMNIAVELGERNKVTVWHRFKCLGNISVKERSCLMFGSQVVKTTFKSRGRRNLTEISVYWKHLSDNYHASKKKNPQNEQKLKPSKFSVWLKKHTPHKACHGQSSMSLLHAWDDLKVTMSRRCIVYWLSTN